jgi:hypothetical protein
MMSTHFAQRRPAKALVKVWVLGMASIVTLMALNGCGWMYDKTMRTLASRSLALAVLGDRLLTGKAMLYTDRTGTLELSDATDTQQTATISCMGTLRYTNSTGGTLELQCSDGAQIRLPYTALSETRGHAAGGGASLTYGLPPAEARALLTPPPGRKLTLVKDNSFACKWFGFVSNCDGSLKLE